MEVFDNTIEMNQLQTNANESITDFPANNISNKTTYRSKSKKKECVELETMGEKTLK